MKKQTLILALLVLSCATSAKDFAWYAGGQPSYSIQKEYGAVVDKALRMFEADMQAVTGHRAEQREGAKVEIYQLDMVNNKEMKLLDSYRVPYVQFITKRDAYWMGVRKNRLIIVGANGRGTAYGVLELSALAGVSPWVWWGDVKPARRHALTFDDSKDILSAPMVDYRGISINHADWSNLLWSQQTLDKHRKGKGFGPRYYHALFELLLRLKGNTLCTPLDEENMSFMHDKDCKAVADSFDICIATGSDEKLKIHELGVKGQVEVEMSWIDDNYGYMSHQTVTGNRKKTHLQGAYYHLSYAGEPHDYLWLSVTQPGLIANEMRRAFAGGARTLWVAGLHDPKVSAYALNIFMDMAWDVNSVKPNESQRYLAAWLRRQFGEVEGKRLVSPMQSFYRLCAIRRPELMGWNRVVTDGKHSPVKTTPLRATEFNAEEFGNELECYLQEFEQVKRQIDGAESSIRTDLKDAFFAHIKYPVYAAAAMATKILEAQEARLIARKQNFHCDDEALESAVRSWNAYTEIQQLTSEYNNVMANGKWKGNMSMSPRDLAVFQEPMLPDKLTAEEINKYGHYRPEAAKLDADGAIAFNAYRFTSSGEGAYGIDMLGHSGRAISLPVGASLTYRFYAGAGNAVLRTAIIPMQADNGEPISYSVSIDGQAPIVYTLSNSIGSERWAENVMRGQAVQSTDIRLYSGNHTLEIRALSDNVIVDQWMIDYDKNRRFYRFPTRN